MILPAPWACLAGQYKLISYMSNQIITLQGMSCGACQKVVTKLLSKIDGVTGVEVNVEAGTAAIAATRTIATEEVVQALAGTHYTIISHS